jgi:hypothetical protein
LNRSLVLIATLVLTITTSSAMAEAGKEIKPLMLKRSKVLLNEEFSAKDVDARWQPAKGQWKIVEGALQGTELKADEHAASIRTDIKLPENFILQFDFKFDGGKVIHLSFNGKGHICRTTLTPAGFTLKGEKVKKDLKDKAATVGQIQQKFEKGKWYTMLVEVKGPEFVARVNDEQVAFGQHAKVARPKSNFGFPMAGVSSSVDNIKIWQGEPSDQWAKTKAGLTPNKIVRPAPPTAAQRFVRQDKDKDGKLSLKEFIGQRPKDKVEAAKKAFGRKDKDKDGSLSAKEYAPVTKSK